MYIVDTEYNESKGVSEEHTPRGISKTLLEVPANPIKESSTTQESNPKGYRHKEHIGAALALLEMADPYLLSNPLRVYTPLWLVLDYYDTIERVLDLYW